MVNLSISKLSSSIGSLLHFCLSSYCFINPYTFIGTLHTSVIIKQKLAEILVYFVFSSISCM